ncbi:HNH endonuclease [Escherichia coli]|jgi:hypothetical protein|uniref:HNH endonuclease n=1 Tax=Enterobacterales TaxID=91347 RepID=UPI00141A65EE|nr:MULTISPECIES: HNH endonuclease [Enterobacterales]EFU0714841.1 HNH endonuclease [Escherichia coli]NIH06925.1 HNH endonuclease [Providencia rettgeri]NIH07201.1 HNH endonuclease [Providencia rettgeri]UUQ28597.1 hypothetical protein KFU87_01755 [Escherichia coli]HCJ9407032.1 hypothetical protein [Escherichia coli]
MKLNTLIHRQGGFCFYCRKPLLERDASIEHIIPSSMGDYQGFTNQVACCTLMNSILQDLPPKHKIELLLNWWGRSPCPKDMALSLKEIEKQRQSILNSSFNEPIYGYKDGGLLTADENVILEVPEELEELRPMKK